MGPAVLLVDDEARLRHLVRLYLEKDGFKVVEAETAPQALSLLRRGKFDLLILDIMLPEGDGWEVCREIRRSSDIPILMLTAKGEEWDRLLGFELGADDYMVKPFSPRELVARVKALLRRSKSGQMEEKRLIFDDLIIDPVAREVSVNGQLVYLTPKEYELLVFMARHPGQALSRERILEQVWGYDFYGDLRTVDTHIKNLREKLKTAATTIGTVWGVGYKFEVNR